MSAAEDELAFHLRVHKIEFEREYRFHPKRRWRFDFAIHEHKLAIEVEGITYFGGREKTGRHQTAKGIEGDLEKYSEAMKLGWNVYRCSQKMVKSGYAIDSILTILGLADLKRQRND